MDAGKLFYVKPKGIDMGDYEIREYDSKFLKDFVRLNTDWITRHFKIEPKDVETLNNAEAIIVRTGGQIFFAVESGKAVGCCAIIRHEDGSWELAKLAVDDSCKGKGYGRILSEAVIDYAKKHGAPEIYLEGNTALAASIALYRKLGFNEVPITHNNYERCNIMMILNLRQK